MHIPNIKFAKSGDANIAYERHGTGPDLVSSTLRDMMLGGSWKFEDRGEHVLNGIEGGWRLYELSR